jgi:transcription antitermination protein NusB
VGVRRKGREYALQALYLVDITDMDSSQAFRAVSKDPSMDPDVRKFAGILMNGTLEHKAEIDVKIKALAQNWEMKRMAALDRNIIRLGAYEILHQLDTPVSVIIYEAVEIAKTFSTPDSGKFVNGILDQIKKERPTAERPSAERPKA